jgi:hypothetical protein
VISGTDLDRIVSHPLSSQSALLTLLRMEPMPRNQQPQTEQLVAIRGQNTLAIKALERNDKRMDQFGNGIDCSY